MVDFSKMSRADLEEYLENKSKSKRWQEWKMRKRLTPAEKRRFKKSEDTIRKLADCKSCPMRDKCEGVCPIVELYIRTNDKDTCPDGENLFSGGLDACTEWERLLVIESCIQGLLDVRREPKKIADENYITLGELDSIKMDYIYNAESFGVNAEDRKILRAIIEERLSRKDAAARFGKNPADISRRRKRAKDALIKELHENE
jgi:radical SAM protein with 4Fe4S-binding SPASM domain